ncbi:DUF2336 domain-containing protein [Sphingomonas sp. DT-204]|uniref:DUF2336 domain-containing protein n=1 Tax=Sphingomonas sp. DT-204 TaxID=3396166 RepID=UPI003F1D95D1
MSEISEGLAGKIGPDAQALLARAAGAESRGRRALRAAIDDAFLAPEVRLDDHARVALIGLIDALVTAIGYDVRDHAARVLTGRGEAGLAEVLAATSATLTDWLAGAGVLRDPELVGECLARVRCELIAAALPAEAPADPDTPSLVVRLTGSTDPVVTEAAAAVLAGESQRRAVAEGGTANGSGLPPMLHRRLAWWVAAALREAVAAAVGDTPSVLDRAVIEAALRNIAANEGQDRLEAAAMRLAEAIDAQADELPTLLDEALRDRRVSVMVAILAHALGVEYEVAREIVLDPTGERLWLSLRALELPRPAIARIGYRLCEADGRRDLDGFVDMLDVVAGLDPRAARRAIAPLTLHPDFRAALAALGSGGRP